MRRDVGLDRRQLLREGRSGRDDVRLDARVLLERRLSAVDARLDVQRARGGDEQRDVTGRDELGDVVPHLLPGDEQVLADVGQARVAGGVGVVGDHRDLGGERLAGGRVERGQADQRDGDAVDAGADGAVERTHHLTDVAVRRSGPLVGAPQQLAGVGGAVLRRGEERIGGDVVDEGELVGLADAEDPRGRASPGGRRGGAGGSGAARRAGAAARARASARLQDQCADTGGAAGQRGAAGDLPHLLEGSVLLLALIPFQPLECVMDDVFFFRHLVLLLSGTSNLATVSDAGLVVQSH